MAQSPVRFVVIGLGGYGLTHIEAVRWLSEHGLAKLTGVVALEVDRRQRPELVSSLKGEGVVLYDDLDHFWESGRGVADVLTVPLGIHAHVPVSVHALESGLHVYCEKPAAATIQDVDILIAAQQRTGLVVTIGYQHLYSNAMQKIKERIVDGRLGRVQSVTLMCGWPRSIQYFTRNDWTGKMRLKGDWILDSPANNANAHYLMNALYLCSDQLRTAATPRTLRAELYRANAIESADTVQMQFETGGGSKVHVLFTHANWYANGPVMHIRCERGIVYWQTDNGKTHVRYAHGGREEFDNQTHRHWRYEGFRHHVDAMHGKDVFVCTPEIARAQTLAINLLHESCPAVAPVAEEHLATVEDWELFPPNTRGTFRRVHNIDQDMHVAFEEGGFFSDMRIRWAGPIESREVTSNGYDRFPVAAALQEKAG